MHLISRLFVILVAFLVACMAAGLVLAIGVAAPDFSGIDSDPVERVSFFGFAFLGTGYGVVAALLPALIAILLAEMAGIRSVLYYALAGALLGLASFYSVDLSAALENTTDIAPVAYGLPLAAAAGLVGGLVYWLIAGRKVGRWRGDQAL
jgi:hypothetical protein